jgi:hypothetical protein
MNAMQLKREIREGVTELMEGVTTTMKKGKGARGCHTLSTCCPLLPYKRVASPPSLTHT